MNKIDLEGQVAVVTGGAQGIGYAIAQRLIQSGARVSLWDFDQGALNAALQTLGPNAHGERADVTDLASLQRAHAQSEAALGPVSILVNSAGIAGGNATLDEYDPAEWRRVVDTNLTGTFAVTKELVRGMMRRRWGRIVTVSSVVGLMGNAGQANSAVWVAIRPEKMNLHKDAATAPAVPECPGAHNVAKGEIKDISYLGDISIFHVQLANGRLIRISRANRSRFDQDNFGAGEKVWVSWDGASPVVLQS